MIMIGQSSMYLFPTHTTRVTVILDWSSFFIYINTQADAVYVFPMLLLGISKQDNLFAP